MAIMNKSDQFLYVGRGPIDSKSLVKTYAELVSLSTWMVNVNGVDTFVAYNGMIVAVWLNKDDTSKNGIYFLFDPQVTTALKKPNVEAPENWHKMAELSDIGSFADRISSIESALTDVESRLTTLEKDKVVIRRDNDYNYRPIEHTLIPGNNEICLVDVAGYGLRVKIGNGTSTFAELSYLDERILNNIDNLIIKGYFYQGRFYANAEHTELLGNVGGRVYIDAISSKLYTYNGVNYEAQSNSLPNATAEIAGAVKLYDQMGQNTDGAMTQRAVTKELNEKFEMDVVEEDEMIVFDTDID